LNSRNDLFTIGGMEIAKADTRQRAITAYLTHQGTQEQIAGIYGVNIRTFQRWLFCYNQTGTAAPLPRGHRHSIYEGDALAALDELVQQHPDATLEELKALSSATCSIMAVHRALIRLRYRYKKNAACQRARA